MIFFMTRRRLEQYIDNCVTNIMHQYGADEIEAKENRINGELEILKKDINKTVSSLADECRQHSTEISKLNEELNSLKQSSKILKNSDSKSDIRKIVEDELRKYAPVQEEQIDKEQLLSEVCLYVNQVIATLNNSMVNEISDKNKKIAQLHSLLQQENKKNVEFEKKIKTQEADILSLNNTIASMKSDIDKLMGGLNELRNSSTNVSLPKEMDDMVKRDDEPSLFFTYDFSKNNSILENIVQQTKLLKTKITTVFNDNQELEIYLKLTNKCIMKIEKIIAKNQNGEMEPEKIAYECVKIYKQTIVQAMSQKKLKDILEEYMKNCKFQKLDWNVGKQLENDDYEYLEEPILYEDVGEKELDCTIRSIKQDTYIIKYVEDGEELEAIIPGIYCLGKYRK